VCMGGELLEYGERSTAVTVLPSAPPCGGAARMPEQLNQGCIDGVAACPPKGGCSSQA
jgi:hypothetical protein